MGKRNGMRERNTREFIFRRRILTNNLQIKTVISYIFFLVIDVSFRIVVQPQVSFYLFIYFFADKKNVPIILGTRTLICIL